MSIKISIKGLVGIFLTLFSGAMFIWTYYMPLRSEEVFIPRISVALIALGGIIILIKDILRSGNFDRTVDLDQNYPPVYIAGVALTLYLYIWLVLRVGFVISTFMVLAGWWVLIEFVEVKRSQIRQELNGRIIRKLILAGAVTAFAYFLFINLIGMYLPPTLLF